MPNVHLQIIGYNIQLPICLVVSSIILAFFILVIELLGYHSTTYILQIQSKKTNFFPGTVQGGASLERRLKLIEMEKIKQQKLFNRNMI